MTAEYDLGSVSGCRPRIVILCSLCGVTYWISRVAFLASRSTKFLNLVKHSYSFEIWSKYFDLVLLLYFWWSFEWFWGGIMKWNTISAGCFQFKFRKRGTCCCQRIFVAYELSLVVNIFDGIVTIYLYMIEEIQAWVSKLDLWWFLCSHLLVISWNMDSWFNQIWSLV